VGRLRDAWDTRVRALRAKLGRKGGSVMAWPLGVAWLRAWRVAPRIRVQSCLASQLSSLRS
jgi:hypothetical protein